VRKKIWVEPPSTDAGHREDVAPSSAAPRSAPTPRRLLIGYAPAHERAAAEEDRRAEHERGAEPEARGGDGADERADHLPDRHPRLDRRHLAADVTADPS